MAFLLVGVLGAAAVAGYGILRAATGWDEPEASGSPHTPYRTYISRRKEPEIDCMICLEKHPQREAAIIDGCGHGFCKAGLKHHVVSKLREGLYPVLCPICAVDRERPDPGAVTYALAQALGLVEYELELWTNLEMSSVSLIIQCPQCLRTFPVDQQDYQCATTVTCPLDDCGTLWCKQCSKRNPKPTHNCVGGGGRASKLKAALRWKQIKKCDPPERVERWYRTRTGRV